MNRIIFALLISCLLLSYGCKKSNPCNNVPKPFVDLQLDLSLPSYIALATPNNWVYVYGGNRGIIVFRKSQTEFSAVDRNCTYDPEKATAIIEVENNNINAVDSVCGSKFQITDGGVTRGPASCTLIQYRTEFNANTNVLRIYN